MPKLKTRKSLSKRIKITKKGKVLRSKAGRRHLMSAKNRKRKRTLRRKAIISVGKKFIKRAMPYAA